MLGRGMIVALVLGLLPGLTAVASQAQFLGWRSVVIQCGETPQAGRVSCKIVVGEKGYEKFSIQAFGKTYALEEADRVKLAGFPLSSLQITHEPGYEELGGYTISFMLQRTHYDKDGKELDTEIASVSVNKKGVSVAGATKKAK